MKRYRYKARDKEGKVVTGIVEAGSEQLAARLVRERGYVLIKLSPVRGTTEFLKSLKNRINYSDLVAFTRQLATMINAGLPMTESLSILRVQAKSSVANVVTQILADVEGGESLSTSMKRHPKIFSPTYIALIKAGEAGGVLDKVLSRLADNMEREQEFRGKVRGALIYPVIIVVGMIVVSVIMVVFVIPRLLAVYEQFDAELPLVTKILLGMSSFVINFWPLVILVLGILFWGLWAYRKTKAGKRKLAELIFKLPIVGELQKEIVLAELTRTLSLMVSSGVPILEAISVVTAVVNNIIISEAVEDVGKQVEKGFPIAFSFAKHPEAFPYLLSQMVAIGEETGKMDEVLLKVSRVFEIDSEQKVKALTSAIEPVVMIVLGIGVAFLVVAVILPIYNLTSAF